MATATPVSAIGDKTAHNATVTRIVPAQMNDSQHVCTNPDQNRIELTAPDGYKYTTVASTTMQVGSSSVSLLRDCK